MKRKQSAAERASKKYREYDEMFMEGVRWARRRALKALKKDSIGHKYEWVHVQTIKNALRRALK